MIYLIYFIFALQADW